MLTLDGKLIENKKRIIIKRNKPIHINYKITSAHEDSGSIDFIFKVDRCYIYLLPKHTLSKKINVRFTK